MHFLHAPCRDALAERGSSELRQLLFKLCALLCSALPAAGFQECNHAGVEGCQQRMHLLRQALPQPLDHAAQCPPWHAHRTAVHLQQCSGYMSIKLFRQPCEAMRLQ